jgi:uncharacterized membrane protein
MQTDTGDQQAQEAERRRARLWPALRARPRLLGCMVFGIVAYAVGATLLPLQNAAMALVAWNAASLLYLLLAWHMMRRVPVDVKDLHGTARGAHLVLALVTIVTSWLFTQVLFALHYAHDFYMARHRQRSDPLDFPGTDDPDYGDFFYFACIIGTSAQTADVSFTDSALRRIGTLHCVLAFFFNATLLALTINVAAGLLQ